MRKPLTKRLAIASHFDMDAAEVENYRYQPTRTPCPVYTAGNDYYTATSPSTRPKGSADYVWEPVYSWVTAMYGNVIWRAQNNRE